MVAAENGSLKGGKAGGLGDVIAGLPQALVKLGWRVTTFVPAYGFLHKENPSKLHATITFPFAGKKITGEFWEVTSSSNNRVRQFVFEHPKIRGERIYSTDPPGQPFMTDATKYALFCSAVGQFLETFNEPYILHLHDWHTPTLLLLKELHPEFAHLKNVKSIFTIHNLFFQGTRPMRGHESSVEGWFPEMFQEMKWITSWKDPRYSSSSYTPMVAGIRFADKINTVSPTYAEEILQPNDRSAGFHGGEGLEKILQEAKNSGKLFGILNGCDYAEYEHLPKLSFQELCSVAVEEIQQWRQNELDHFWENVQTRIESLRNLSSPMILTNVTRVTEQKVRLFVERGTKNQKAIDEIAALLAKHNGVFFLLGNGSKDYELLLEKACSQHERFVFLRGYSDKVAKALYANGDLFLMPSLFEPCGISQMIAMGCGQPCVVHAVGGLRDTVKHGVCGFTFTGATIQEKVDNFISVVGEAAEMFRSDTERWERIRSEVSKAQFTWEVSASKYIGMMYE
jgi:starch synthase